MHHINKIAINVNEHWKNAKVIAFCAQNINCIIYILLWMKTNAFACLCYAAVGPNMFTDV
jgi:hypothetical protein